MKFLIYRAEPDRVASDFVLGLAGTDQPFSRRQEPVVIRVAHIKEAIPKDVLNLTPFLRTVELGLAWYGDFYQQRGIVWIHAQTRQFSVVADRWVRVTRIRPIIAEGMRLPVYAIESSVRLSDYL